MKDNLQATLTFISDTHGQHELLTNDLPGGDIIFHSGDFSKVGYYEEVTAFCKWFEALPYKHKVFIAGNHEITFERNPEEIAEIIKEYDIIYLEDSSVELMGLTIYGSPHQPEFHNWAFNLPRNGTELEEVWSKIPTNTDILLTHTPPFGILDTVEGKRSQHLGCEKLTERLKQLSPKVHSFGHIHSGNGLLEIDGTTYMNASVLDEWYLYAYKPKTLVVSY